MIDREARKYLREKFLQFLEGNITDYELDCACDKIVRSEDVGVRECYGKFVLQASDSPFDYYVEPEEVNDEPFYQQMKVAALYLGTDYEYERRPYYSQPGWKQMAASLNNFLKSGSMDCVGDEDGCWPFKNEEQKRAAEAKEG